MRRLFAFLSHFLYHRPMKYAIFSDIHNNSQALSAVLRDAARRHAEAFICLGDIGTDPSVQLVRNIHADAVFGNWEVFGWRYLSAGLQPWALNLPPMRKYPRFWVSHAAPTWPADIASLQQYLKARHSLSAMTVFPYYLADSEPLWKAIATLLEADIPLLFHGHTHQQAVWQLSGDNRLQKLPPAALTLEPQSTYIIGVGSVGQPKDSNLPSYVIFNSDSMQVDFIRIDEA